MESLVLAVDDDIHHGADLHVDDVVSALATFTEPGLKALQRSGRECIKSRSVSVRVLGESALRVGQFPSGCWERVH